MSRAVTHVLLISLALQVSSVVVADQLSIFSYLVSPLVTINDADLFSFVRFFLAELKFVKSNSNKKNKKSYDPFTSRGNGHHIIKVFPPITVLGWRSG